MLPSLDHTVIFIVRAGVMYLFPEPSAVTQRGLFLCVIFAIGQAKPQITSTIFQQLELPVGKVRSANGHRLFKQANVATHT